MQTELLMRCLRPVPAALILAAILVGHPRAEAPPVAGNWFMEGTEHNVFAQFIYHRSPDGRFDVRIRQMDHWRPTAEWVESGTWTYVDRSIQQVTSTVDGKRVYYRDTFVIDSEVGDSYAFHDPSTGVNWLAMKVPDDFKFPLREECAVS